MLPIHLRSQKTNIGLSILCLSLTMEMIGLISQLMNNRYHYSNHFPSLMHQFISNIRLLTITLFNKVCLRTMNLHKPLTATMTQPKPNPNAWFYSENRISNYPCQCFCKNINRFSSDFAVNCDSIGFEYLQIKLIRGNDCSEKTTRQPHFEFQSTQFSEANLQITTNLRKFTKLMLDFSSKANEE